MVTWVKTATFLLSGTIAAGMYGSAVFAADVDMKFREIVWAVEEGALIKFEPRFAVNIALKKLKNGLWTRPNRMPPNWRRAVA